MPVISKQRMYFDGGAWYKVVKCSSSGEFSIELPASIVKVLHQNCVVADTCDKVELEWKRALQRFKDAQTSKRKVICYQFAFIECERSDLSFGQGLGMTVWANVFIETRIKEEGRDHYDYDYVSEEDGNTIPDDLLCRDNFSNPMSDLRGDSFEKKYHEAKDGRRGVLDWTAEREAFFTSLIKGMRGMMDKVQKFTGSKKDMMQLADSHTKLLGIGRAGGEKE